jgi:hypothetical protein
MTALMTTAANAGIKARFASRVIAFLRTFTNSVPNLLICAFPSLLEERTKQED